VALAAAVVPGREAVDAPDPTLSTSAFLHLVAASNHVALRSVQHATAASDGTATFVCALHGLPEGDAEHRFQIRTELPTSTKIRLTLGSPPPAGSIAPVTWYDGTIATPLLTRTLKQDSTLLLTADLLLPRCVRPGSSRP